MEEQSHNAVKEHLHSLFGGRKWKSFVRMKENIVNPDRSVYGLDSFRLPASIDYRQEPILGTKLIKRSQLISRILGSAARVCRGAVTIGFYTAAKTAHSCTYPTGRHSFCFKDTQRSLVSANPAVLALISGVSATLISRLHPHFESGGTHLPLYLGLGALCVQLTLCILGIRYIHREFECQLEMRLAEQGHDLKERQEALLQNLHGLVLLVHTATKQVPSAQPARHLLESALVHADGVIKELSTHAIGDVGVGDDDRELAAVLEEDGTRLATESGITFAVNVYGNVERVHVFIKREVRQIVREALTNAFQHSAARHVRVELAFTRRALRVAILDDGRGLEQHVLDESSKPGHRGFLGMHERARKIGGELTVRSTPGLGTAVVLDLSGRVFSVRPRRSIFGFPHLPY